MRNRSMLASLFLAGCLGGCQAWPRAELPCSETDRCAPLRFVLGQPDAASNNLPGGLSIPAGVLRVGERLLISDCSNHRVLIWNRLPERDMQPADVVLGQPSLTTSVANHGGLSDRSLSCPRSLASDGTRLAVADSDNDRVLIWNAFPTHHYQGADVVLGQDSPTANGFLEDATSGRRFGRPVISWDPVRGRLYVVDRDNHRVLGWNGIPAANRPADFLLGQPALDVRLGKDGARATSCRGITTAEPDARVIFPVVSAATFFCPSSVASDGQRLAVTDASNHRVLLWSQVPAGDSAASSMTPADVVLGQPSKTVRQANSGGLSDRSLATPAQSAFSGDRLHVVDQANHRVLLFSPIPTADFAPAQLVLGQATFLTNAGNEGGLSARSMSSPSALHVDGDRLFVADSQNNRVLFFGARPAQSGQAADRTLGQPGAGAGERNNPVDPERRFARTQNAVTDGQRLFLCDQDNSRVLIWSRLPQGPDERPVLVLGQPDLRSNRPNLGGAPDARTLNRPSSVFTDGTRLLVTDAGNHRVLIWGRIPTSSFAPADLVLGQPDFTTTRPNAGGLSGRSLFNPSSAFIAGGRLYVADLENNRVLVWRDVPTASFSEASFALGQADLTAGRPNRGQAAPTAATLSSPNSVYSDGTRLFVTDLLNHRLLLWSRLPEAGGAPADLVLGQADGTVALAVRPITARTLLFPRYAVMYGERLYVTDRGNNRVLYWNRVPTMNEQAADGVVGQADVNSGLPNDGGLGIDTLSQPGGVLPTADLLYIGDSENSRLLVVPAPRLP